MESVKSPPESTRLEARISAEQKALIERAAAYEGRAVSEFVIQSAQQAARTVVDQNETLRLNSRQSRALVEAMLNPPRPNRKLRDALKEYRRSVRSR